MGRKWWIVLGVMVAALFWSAADAAPVKEKPVFTPPEQTWATEASLPQMLEFPAVVPGTQLILQNIAQYEGPFLEDAAQEPVSGIMALTVYNPSGRYIACARIQLQQGERTLYFEITMLPPGSRVLVLEKGAQPYAEAAVNSCRCLFLEASEEGVAPGISVKEENGVLVVTNLGQTAAEYVTIYYKQYHAQQDLYLGGNTDYWEIGTLAPGQHREVVPYRYVSGYSRIVGVAVRKQA